MSRLLVLVFAVGARIGLPSPAAATLGVDVDCWDFADQAAAQNHLAAHPGDPDHVDGNADGRGVRSAALSL